MNRILESAIVVSLALYGCATPAYPPPHGDRVGKKLACDGTNNCQVGVTVNCAWLQCSVAVDVDPVVILGKNRLNITWILGTPGYAFADNGIVVNDPDFDCKADGKTKFVCMDKHTTFSVNKYTVNVTGLAPLDPWIVNQ